MLLHRAVQASIGDSDRGGRGECVKRTAGFPGQTRAARLNTLDDRQRSVPANTGATTSEPTDSPDSNAARSAISASVRASSTTIVRRRAGATRGAARAWQAQRREPGQRDAPGGLEHKVAVVVEQKPPEKVEPTSSAAAAAI